MAYGYRIFRTRLTQTRKLDPSLQFDNPTFGPGGAAGLIHRALADMVTVKGEKNDAASTFFRLEEAGFGGWVVGLIGSGGEFGVEREVVDVNTLQTQQGIRSTDVVLTKMPFLLVTPPYGDAGLLIAGVQGRSHLTPGFTRALNRRLAIAGVVFRLEHDFTDATAWNEFLAASDIDVSAVELIQHTPSADGTRFGNESVQKAVLTLEFGKGGTETKGKVMKVLDAARKTKTKPQLTGLVGLSVADDSDFDEQRVVYVQDGRKRKIAVNSGWPAFIYALSTDEVPDVATLLAETRDDAEYLLNEMKIDRHPTWWPSAKGLEAIEATTDGLKAIAQKIDGPKAIEAKAEAGEDEHSETE